MDFRQSVTIPTVLKVGNGMLDKIGQILIEKQIDKVVLFFGNDLIELFGSQVIDALSNAGVNVLSYMELDSICMQDVVELAFSMNNQSKAVIGIGGGKVIDAAKYAAFLKKLPFISVPTSASSDGFSSSSASMLVSGKRTSVPAKMAYGIIVDIDVLKSAPEKFIYSGIGDMVSKITSLYDWCYEQQQGVSIVDDFAMIIAKKAVNSFVRTPFKSIKDDLFLKELVNSLALSGIANELAGSSVPVSGSEHLISHALDKLLEPPQLHGIQVGIATYLMSKVQNHRFNRINTVFKETGFWNYVKTLEMRKSDFAAAIDIAPTIKPHRHTYLHEEKYREEAKQLLYEDKYLNDILF